MNHFRALGHIDTFAAVARLYAMTTSAAFPLEITPEWKSGTFVLQRIAALIGENDFTLTAARVEKVSTLVPIEAAPDSVVIVSPLWTNPNMFAVCGGESVSMYPGSAWAISRLQPAALMNGGKPAYVLVAEFAKREPA